MFIFAVGINLRAYGPPALAGIQNIINPYKIFKSMSEIREIHNEELQALVARMREQGLNAEVADVPVPVCSCPVQAGIPTPFGDMVAEDYVMVPRSLLGDHPLFVFPVRGESMRDAGFHDGDNLLVELDVMVNDGDTVVCSIDDEYTVKTFFTDDDGVHWLVPANDAFDPICLSEQFRVVVVGRVRHVLSRLGRSSYRELAQRVKQKAKGSAAAAPTVASPLDGGLLAPFAKAMGRVQEYMWAQSAYAVLFCELRDHHNYPNNMSLFGREADALATQRRWKHHCAEKTIGDAFRRNDFLLHHVDEWADINAPARARKLQQQFHLACQIE